MFGSSTQYKYWTFKDENELGLMRNRVNKEFIERNSKAQNVPVSKFYFF